MKIAAIEFSSAALAQHSFGSRFGMGNGSSCQEQKQEVQEVHCCLWSLGVQD